MELLMTNRQGDRHYRAWIVIALSMTTTGFGAGKPRCLNGSSGSPPLTITPLTELSLFSADTTGWAADDSASGGNIAAAGTAHSIMSVDAKESERIKLVMTLRAAIHAADVKAAKKYPIEPVASAQLH